MLKISIARFSEDYKGLYQSRNHIKYDVESFGVTCIDNVFESDVFDETIQSLSSGKVLNASVIPILHGELNQVRKKPLTLSLYIIFL